MGLTQIQDALVAKVQTIEGLDECYLGAQDPQPTSQAPYAWVEVRYLGSDRLTYGNDGLVMSMYRGAVHVVLGGGDMAEEDARAEAGPYPARFREAFFADDTLGGAVWDIRLSPNQSTDTLDQYQDVDDMLPELIVVLDITDEEASSTPAP